MSDDPILTMHETQAELEKMKDEMREIQKQNSQLKNEIAFKNVLETVNGFQSKLDVLSTNVKEIQQAFAALSNRVSNHDDKFSELNQNLRKINETLNKHDTILSQNNEIQTKQNEITQVLNTSENNLGGKDGSKDLDTLLILENHEQSWKELNIKLPYGILSHGAQFLSSNIYIFGGENGDKALNSTYALSKSLQWEKMADMNEKRRHILNSSVTLNNQIWVCGGWNKGALKSVEMYDPLTNKWKYMKEMNECRWDAAAAVVNGKIFCSGWDISVECYDSSSDVWTLVSNMSQKIWGHGAVEIDGHFISIGGYCGGCLKNVLALDTTNKGDKWIDKSPMSIPREDFSIAKIDDKIFVCGGVVECSEPTDSVEIFDGEVWRNGPKMPTFRVYAPAVVIPMSFVIHLK